MNSTLILLLRKPSGGQKETRMHRMLIDGKLVAADRTYPSVNPATGQVIRRLSSTVGVLRATDVDDSSAVCTIISDHRPIAR